MSTAGTLVCPVLVGRDEELVRIRHAVARAEQSGSVVAVIGEAGIGKTRLLAEAASLARERGHVVLPGECRERAQAPYAAVTAALRRHARTLDLADLRRLFGGAAQLTASLLPEVLDALDINIPPLALTAANLAAAVAEHLMRLREDAPVTMIVDDLHYADADTLELLRHLAADAPSVRLCLVVTARVEELWGGAPLVAALGSMQRLSWTEEVRLGPLSDTEVATMLSALIGCRAPAELVETMRRRSGGVPFVIEELHAAATLRVGEPRAADDDGASATGACHVPLPLRAAVLGRMRSLPPDARRLLELAAIAGTMVDRRLIARAADVSVAEVDSVIEEAVQRCILVETADGDGAGCAFRHALTRDALLAELSVGDRRSAHSRIAAALCEIHRRDVGQVSARIAGHYLEAEEHAKALPFFVDAARHAASQGAPATTLALFRSAVELAPQIGADPLPILLEALQNTWLIVETDVTADLAREARRLARLRGDTAAEAMALFSLATHANRGGGSPREALVTMREAVELTRGRGDALELRALVSYARWLANDAGSSEVRAVVERGRALAKTCGTELTAAGLDRALAFCADTPPDEAEAALDRSIRVARVAGRPQDELIAVDNAATMAMWHHRLQRAVDLELRAIGLCDLLPSYRAAAQANLATIYAVAGRFEDALDVAAQIRETREGAVRPKIALALVSVYLSRGDLVAARGVVIAQGPPDHPIEHNVALLVQLAHDAAAAPPVVDALLAGAWPPGQPLSRFSVQFARTAGVLARALYECGEVERLRRLVPMMSRHDPLSDVGVGLLALAEGRQNVARTSLRSALPVFEHAPEPVLHVRTLIDLARAQSAAGSRKHAAGSLMRAQQIASDVTAWGLVAEAQKVARVLGIRVASVAETAQSRGLSPRQAEVAALVAAGCSNAEVARRLHLSAATVGGLVSTILAKLEVRTRAELAAWVAADGLPAAVPPHEPAAAVRAAR